MEVLIMLLVVIFAYCIYVLFFEKNKKTGKRAYAEGLGKWLIAIYILRGTRILIEESFEIDRAYAIVISGLIVGIIYLIYKSIRSSFRKPNNE